MDKALQVIDEYHSNITNLEHDILLKPKMSRVRKCTLLYCRVITFYILTVCSVHILSGDLILHKRTLEPIKTLIYGLRRYDDDKCRALIDFSDPANEGVKVVGFMSHTSKIYLVGPVFAVLHWHKLTAQR